MFRRMGFKPPSSGKLFDDYVAGGAGAQPLIVGYENQLVEWVLQDADRWKRVEANAPAKPVILYPLPNRILGASADQHQSRRRRADRCADGARACSNSPGRTTASAALLGTVGRARNALLQSRLIERVDAVLPMPDAPVMLALLDRLAA